MKSRSRISGLLMMTMAVAVTSACAISVSVRVEEKFPTVVSEPRDLNAVLVLDDAFQAVGAVDPG